MKRTRRRRQVHVTHCGALNARGRKRQYHNRYRYRVYCLFRQSEPYVNSRDMVFARVVLTIPKTAGEFMVYRLREGSNAS